MKITCSQAELMKGLNIVSKAVPTRTTMSILECILIDASASDIRLTSNDMEIGIETIIPGSIEERGRVALDAKIFVDIARRLPNNQVVITADERLQTQIDCEKAHFTVPGKNGEDFPYLPVIPRNVPIEISQFTLRETIRQTIFSISENDNNRMMGGELFEIKGDNLRVASLDGHRISIRNLRLKESYEDTSVVVPGKTLNEISKIISGSLDEMVQIYITENHIIFEFDQTTVVSRLIEGEFFRIDQMLSSDYETKLAINRKDLIESIDRATLMVNESDKKPIILNIHDQVFNMTISTFRGNFEEELTTMKEGRDIMIAFNPKFIIEALRAIDDENVTMYMLTPKSPCFIRNDNGDYIYLILPVNFNAG